MGRKEGCREMSGDTDWMEGEVKEPDAPVLDAGQIYRLMRMTACLRDNEAVLATVLEIKQAIRGDDGMLVKQLYGSLEEHEQEAVWVAPKFGGIFTTDERKIIRNGEKEA